MKTGDKKYYAYPLGLPGPLYKVIEVVAKTQGAEEGTVGVDVSIDLLGDTPVDALRRMYERESERLQKAERDIGAQRQALAVLKEQCE